MAIISISPADQLALWKLAQDRNRGKHNNRRGWGGNSAEQNHYIGLLGEHAASIVLDGHVLDRNSYGAKGDGGRADLVGPAGGISVKMRTKRGYDLALQSDKLDDFKADAAVLCWPGDDITQRLLCSGPKPLDVSITIDVVGVVSYHTFAAKAHFVDFGWGRRLALGHEHFTPIPRPLWEWEVAVYIKNS